MANLLRRAIQQSVSDAFDFAKVFATTLYTGNGTTQDIVSDLDFVAGEGLVWAKRRSGQASHALTDTKRGAPKYLNSDTTASEGTSANYLNLFSDDGFTMGANTVVNGLGSAYVAWQFMEKQGFFDIVEYTGDGVVGRTVALDLDDGSAVFGMSIVKRRELGGIWVVQHKDIAATNYMALSSTQASAVASGAWNNVAATFTTLTLGVAAAVNAVGSNYISYNFAHNPAKGIFCGSYTGTGAAGNKITTGFPVGWVLIKRTSGSADWWMLDVKRGMTGATQPYLRANTTAAEASTSFVVTETDGFTVNITGADANGSGQNYIFMAIADPAQF